jgi:hypothetical protein
MNGRLLVFNCHEAWVYQLRLLDMPMDIVVGLPGRHTLEWDVGIRPVPPKSRLVTLREVLAARENYDCVVAHNLTDLLDAKTLQCPRLLVIHVSLDGLVLEQDARIGAKEFRDAVAVFTQRTGAHVVAVSAMKGKSWGFGENLVPLMADPADYLPWRGDLPLRAAGLQLRLAAGPDAAVGFPRACVYGRAHDDRRTQSGVAGGEGVAGLDGIEGDDEPAPFLRAHCAAGPGGWLQHGDDRGHGRGFAGARELSP